MTGSLNRAKEKTNQLKRNGIVPVLSLNKGCQSKSSVIAATEDGELMSLEETQEKKNICHLAAIRLQPLPMLSPKETQDVEDTGYWPQIGEVPIKGMISVSPDLHLPIHRKALNSLT